MELVPRKVVVVDTLEEPDLDHESILNPLRNASSSGDLGIVKQLLEGWLESADPRPPRFTEEPFSKLQKALEAAFANEKLQVAAYLLGFRITEDVVHDAVDSGSIEALELLLDHGWDINDRWGGRCRLPSICVAVRRRSIRLVTWFLNHSASPNLQGNAYISATPMTFAASHGTIEIASLMISHGGDVKHGDVLIWAIRSKRDDREPMLRYMLEAGAPANALEHEANPPRFKIALDRRWAHSPLHNAVTMGKWTLVRVLVEFGASWDDPDPTGVSARDIAREKRVEDMINELK